MGHVLLIEAFAALGAPATVYVRPVTGAALIAHLSEKERKQSRLKPKELFYELHRANGEYIQTYEGRNAAVGAALLLEYVPVSVH